MAREMCKTCPFNPDSPLFHLRDNWVAHLDNEMFAEGHPTDGSVAQSCHEINDCGETTNSAEQCIGHLRHLSLRGEAT